MSDAPPPAEPDPVVEPFEGVIERDPGEAPPTLPSTLARAVALLAVVVAGAAGAFIGYAVTDLQCTGDCTVPNGIAAVVGGAIAAVGVAVVVQLALRAMAEWRVVEARGGARLSAAERNDPRVARRGTRPRVR